MPGMFSHLHYNDTSLFIALEEPYSTYRHRGVICGFCLYFTAIFHGVFSCAMIQSQVHFNRYWIWHIYRHTRADRMIVLAQSDRKLPAHVVHTDLHMHLLHRMDNIIWLIGVVCNTSVHTNTLLTACFRLVDSERYLSYFRSSLRSE